MAILKTTPVVFCKRCGKPLTITALTTKADPNGELLQQIVKLAVDNALCSDCQNARLYYIGENRMEDFHVRPD